MDNYSNRDLGLAETWTNGMTLISTDSSFETGEDKFVPQTCLLNVIQMDQIGTPAFQLTNSNETIGLLIRAQDINQPLAQDQRQLFQIQVDDEDVNIEDNLTLATNNSPGNPNDSETLEIDEGKPLGSSENPIQFVQHGETFHSTQNISQEQLRQIAEALQLQAGKTKESTILVDPASSSSKIVYRVVYPEDLDLQPLKQSIKRGRPKKREGAGVAPAADEEDEEFSQPVITKSSRTRSGRITKPPRHIQKAFKQVDVEPKHQIDHLQKIEPTVPVKKNLNGIDPITLEPRKRPIAAQFRCPVCRKAYLGRSRMLKHFEVNPDHGPIPDNLKPKHDELWTQTVERAQKAPEHQRAVQFCHELSRLIRNARILVPFLFKPPANAGGLNYHVDENLANALGLHPGNYSLDESALGKDVSTMLSSLPDGLHHGNLMGDSTGISSIDELLPAVDTGQVSIDLDGSSNSDDVMNVDQLVNERLKNLTDAELEPSMNHSLNLDLSLDLFSFNPS